MKPRLLLCTLALALVIAGCASAPIVTDPSGTDVAVSLLSEDDLLSRFGSAVLDLNPYLAPGSGLMGVSAEFVVLRIDVAASNDCTLSIDLIDAKNPAGVRVAQFFDWNEYKAFMFKWQVDERDYSQMMKKAERTYLPALDVPMRQGKHSYYVVLAGKRPIARPFDVIAQMHIDNGNSRTFTFSVDK